MTDTYDSTKCLARTAKNPSNQCSNNQYGNECFCRIHIKSKSVRRIDEPLITSVTSISSNKTTIIPILSSNRLRMANVTVASLRASLRFYKLPDNGRKQALFSKLQSYFTSLYGFISETSKILTIQKWYRNILWKRVKSLQGPAQYNPKCCVNEEDILTFDTISSIPSQYLFSFRDYDSFVYGFDIRSINEILKRDSKNPYNRSKFNQDIINNACQLIRLLTILGIDVSIQQEDITDPHLQMKQRVIDIFQKMDSLDQYTNPEWFLSLRNYELANYYKEAEDVWNYRLGLTDQTKRKIYPPTGKVFPISVSVVKHKTDVLELQNICLDFMEKLITSASKHDDKVNGCIYALLGLVIVSPGAAEALPSYYSMVSVHSNNNEVIPV